MSDELTTIFQLGFPWIVSTNNNKIYFDITPQPFVPYSTGDTTLLMIPEVCFYLQAEDRYPTKEERKHFRANPMDPAFGCDDFKATGYCKHTLRKTSRARKKRILRYRQYKKDLKQLATDIGFELPLHGASIYFYFPMPDRWSGKKKRMMHGQMKFTKPDYDNCIKAVQDSLLKQDEKVAQISGSGKFWVNQPNGYIEILLNQPLYNPFNVTFI